MTKVLLVLAFVLSSAIASFGQTSVELWRQVEIIRTTHGVPHIRAENLRAAGYALAWLQCEDYGPAGTPTSILQSSGRRAMIDGKEYLDADFFILRHRERTLKNYGSLSRDVREMYEGFATGVNRYIELNRDKFPANMPADFTAQDVAATEIIGYSTRKVRNFVTKLNDSARAGFYRRDPKTLRSKRQGSLQSPYNFAGLMKNISFFLTVSASRR